jgi:hypothetical protein
MAFDRRKFITITTTGMALSVLWMPWSVRGDDMEQLPDNPDDIIVFGDDEAELFYADSMLGEIQAGKKRCGDLSLEANYDAAGLGMVAAGLSIAPGMQSAAALATFASGAEWWMGTEAQRCANDPPRQDTSVVTKFKARPAPPPPIHGAPWGELNTLAAAATQAASAIAALTISIERFGGARAKYSPRNATSRHHLVLQANAISYNAVASHQQLQNVHKAATAVTNGWSNTSQAAANIGKLSPAELSQRVKSSWQSHRAAFGSSFGVPPQALAAIDAQVANHAKRIASGAISPATAAKSAVRQPASASAVQSGTALKGIAVAFAKAAKSKQPKA